MDSTQVRDKTALGDLAAPRNAFNLEVVAIPVSDVDRAKRFYDSLGWRLDADFAVGDEFRVVQFTAPGSACSIHFGKGVTSAAPGSARGLYLVVSDIEAARAELVGRRIDVSRIFHRAGPGQPSLDGPDPQRRSYSSFASFGDPDGNGWLLQEINARLPGRGLSSMDVATLTGLLREAEEGHGKYELSAPKHHWSGWYAAYLVARQRGKTPQEAADVAALDLEAARR